MELKPSYFVEKELVFCWIIAEIDNPMNLDIFVLYVDLNMTAKSGPISNETGWWLQVIVLHFPSIHRCTSDDYSPRL